MARTSVKKHKRRIGRIFVSVRKHRRKVKGKKKTRKKGFELENDDQYIDIYRNPDGTISADKPKRVRKRAWLDDEDIPTDLPKVEGFMGGGPILRHDKAGWGWTVPGGRRLKSSRDIHKVKFDPKKDAYEKYVK